MFFLFCSFFFFCYLANECALVGRQRALAKFMPHFICVACRKIVDEAEGYFFLFVVRADGRSRSRSSEVTAIVTFSFSSFLCLTRAPPSPLPYYHPRLIWVSACPRAELPAVSPRPHQSLLRTREIFFSQAVSSLYTSFPHLRIASLRLCVVCRVFHLLPVHGDARNSGGGEFFIAPHFG